MVDFHALKACFHNDIPQSRIVNELGFQVLDEQVCSDAYGFSFIASLEIIGSLVQHIRQGQGTLECIADTLGRTRTDESPCLTDKGYAGGTCGYLPGRNGSKDEGRLPANELTEPKSTIRQP